MDKEKEKILIVDDDRINRVILATNLQEIGYQIFFAENGKQALEKIREEKFDLVLLDLVMPVMDGFETLKRMKADDMIKRIPVVIISAQDETENLIKTLEIGAVDYIPKPFDSKIIRSRVLSALASKKLSQMDGNIDSFSSSLENIKKASKLLDEM